MLDWETEDNLVDAYGELAEDEGPLRPADSHCTEWRTEDVLVRLDGDLYEADKMSRIGVDGFYFGDCYMFLDASEDTRLEFLEDDDYFGPGYPISMSNISLSAYGDVYIGNEVGMERQSVPIPFRFIAFLTGKKLI